MNALKKRRRKTQPDFVWVYDKDSKEWVKDYVLTHSYSTK